MLLRQREMNIEFHVRNVWGLISGTFVGIILTKAQESDRHILCNSVEIQIGWCCVLNTHIRQC
jgi:hypothetical protein